LLGYSKAVAEAAAQTWLEGIRHWCDNTPKISLKVGDQRVSALSLETFKTRLDGALSNLV